MSDTLPTVAASTNGTGPAEPGDPLEAILRSLEALGGNGGNGGDDGGEGEPSPAPAPASPATAPAAPAADQIARHLEARARSAGPSVDQLQHELVVQRQAMVQLVERQRRPVGYRYNSWGEILRASAAGELGGGELDQLNRALVDTTTADIPGLVPRPALAQIMDIIVRSQPLADAAATVPLPDAGMTIDYPDITARPSVGVQTTEKGDIVSAQTTVAPPRKTSSLWPAARTCQYKRSCARALATYS